MSNQVYQKQPYNPNSSDLVIPSKKIVDLQEGDIVGEEDDFNDKRYYSLRCRSLEGDLISLQIDQFLEIARQQEITINQIQNRKFDVRKSIQQIDDSYKKQQNTNEISTFEQLSAQNLFFQSKFNQGSITDGTINIPESLSPIHLRQSQSRVQIASKRSSSNDISSPNQSINKITQQQNLTEQELKLIPLSCRIDYINFQKQQQRYSNIQRRKTHIPAAQQTINSYKNTLRNESSDVINKQAQAASTALTNQMQKTYAKLLSHHIKKNVTKFQLFDKKQNNDKGNQNIKQDIQTNPLIKNAQNKINKMQETRRNVSCSSKFLSRQTKTETNSPLMKCNSQPAFELLLRNQISYNSVQSNEDIKSMNEMCDSSQIFQQNIPSLKLIEDKFTQQNERLSSSPSKLLNLKLLQRANSQTKFISELSPIKNNNRFYESQNFDNNQKESQQLKSQISFSNDRSGILKKSLRSSLHNLYSTNRSSLENSKTHMSFVDFDHKNNTPPKNEYNSETIQKQQIKQNTRVQSTRFYQNLIQRPSQQQLKIEQSNETANKSNNFIQNTIQITNQQQIQKQQLLSQYQQSSQSPLRRKGSVQYRNIKQPNQVQLSDYSQISRIYQHEIEDTQKIKLLNSLTNQHLNTTQKLSFLRKIINQKDI